MKFKLEKNLVQMFPTYREGILIIQNFTQGNNSDGSYQYLDFITNRVRRTDYWKHVFNFDTGNSPWSEYFNKFQKCDPSHIALTRRIIQAQDLPNINIVTNTINAVQLAHQIPIGAHDTDEIEGDVTVGFNTKGFSFTPRNSEEIEGVDTDEIVHMDNKEVLTRRWCWRQGKKDLITADSHNFVIFLNTLDEKTKLDEIAEEIVSILKRFSETEIKVNFDVLSAKNHEIDTVNMKEFKTSKLFKFKTYSIRKDKEIIDRILDKAVEDILPSKEVLKDILLSGKRIKVYQGFDPTAPTLHIGHSVMMRKLEDFRKLGHEVVMLIGDFTGRIGDPTDKGSARKVLTEEQVNENLKLYKEQAKSLIDIDNKENPVTVVFNNDWLGKLGFQQIVDIASNFTVQQMIKRDMFQKRLEEDRPIHLHEFLYPLMQGYDSVHMEVDIEIGGNDQLFNMLAGRTLVEKLLNKQKFVIAGKLLTTASGTKMGKSEGNMIMLSDTPENIFGKVMAMSDDQIVQGFELLTNSSMDEVEQIERELKSGKNPMEYKKRLAYETTKELKGEGNANTALKYFESVFQKKESNVKLEEMKVSKEKMNILDLLLETNMTKSKSEGRRLIQQGAVYINDVKVKDFGDIVKSKDIILKVGRRVLRVI